MMKIAALFLYLPVLSRVPLLFQFIQLASVEMFVGSVHKAFRAKDVINNDVGDYLGNL